MQSMLRERRNSGLAKASTLFRNAAVQSRSVGAKSGFLRREHHTDNDLKGFVARFRLMLVAAVEFIRLLAGYPEIIKQMIVESG